MDQGVQAKPDRVGPDAARLDEKPKVDNDLYVRVYDKCILCCKYVDACGDQWQNTFAISVSAAASTPISPSNTTGH
jgi:predicted molibdopterin-dependent oxidoreductase YjgC